MVFDLGTVVGWKKIKKIFEEMINNNLKKSSTFEKVRNLIEETYKFTLFDL